MTKNLSKKAIKAEVINEVAKRYKKNYSGQIATLKEALTNRYNENKELSEENARLEAENSRLTDKLNQYEDWIARLQEWCNLPDDERDKAIKQFRVSHDANCRLNELMQMIDPYISMIFR